MILRLSLLPQPFQPPLESIRHYSWWKLRKDLVAGLTVSVVEVPQAMAYALIAGVPPQYGLYTSIIQGILGALLSSGEHLTTGPTNTQSLLIASAVTRLARDHNPVDPQVFYLQMVFGLTLLKGLIQLGFAAANMGSMVRYVSRSVIVGVAAGAGVLIVVGQLPHFLGLHVPDDAPRHLPGILGSFERMIPHLHEINGRALGIGALALAIVVGVRLFSRLLPGSLLAVVVSAAIVASLHWAPTGGSSALPVISALPTGRDAIPHPQMPHLNWALAEELVGGALALALLGMLESVAIGKALAAHTGDRINANQEFFAQGFTNFVSSFFQCIPGSGSFTRSALDYAAGAQTRFAAVFNACFVGTIFWLLAGQARYIPLSSLAAVLFVIAYGLIEWNYIPRTLRSSRSDAIVCLITFLSTLLAPLEFAIFIGIFLNIGLYLRTASRLHMAEMVQTPGGPFIERPLHDRSGHKAVMFLQMEGDLFFAVADELQDRLTDLLHSEVRIVILRLKRTHSIDATALGVLEQFARDIRARNGYLILCGVKFDLLRVFKAYGLTPIVGRENIFETGGGVFTSAKRALQRAKELLGRSIDDAHIETEEVEDFTYEI